MHWPYLIINHHHHHHHRFFLFDNLPSLLFSFLFLFLFLFITITVSPTPQLVYSLYFGDTINIIESDKLLSSPSSPKIATTDGGNVYVTWIDKNILYFKSSHDHGSKFNTPIILSKNVNSTSSPQLDATEGGNVYVVWVDKKNNSTYGGDTDIAFKWSTDAGKTFSSKKLSRGLNMSSSLSPQLDATEGGNVYVVWSNNQTHFKEILGNNAIFGETINISNNTDSAYPQLAATEGDNVYLVWIADKHNTHTEKVLYFKRISNFLFD